MSMRRRSKLIWWLLPLLALRALVPAGFMLDTSNGDLAIVVCPGHSAAVHGPFAEQMFAGAVDSDAPDTQLDTQHAQSKTQTGAQHSQSTFKLCPFAAAAGAALHASAPVILTGVPATISVDSADLAGPELPFGPVRAQQSRAPPYFS